MTEPVTGRRRCGIREHRKQIKLLQEQVVSARTAHYAMWLKVQACERERSELRKRLTARLVWRFRWACRVFGHREWCSSFGHGWCGWCGCRLMAPVTPPQPRTARRLAFPLLARTGGRKSPRRRYERKDRFGMTFSRVVWLFVRCCLGVVLTLAWFTLMFSLVNQQDTLALVAGAVGLGIWVLLMAYLVKWEFVRVAKWCGLVMLVLLSVGCSKTVPPGHVGVQVDYYGGNRGVKDIPIVSGVVWYNPWTTDILQYPTYVQSAVWSASVSEGHPVNEEITFTNRDQMQISVDVSLSYHLNQPQVPSFYVKFRSDDLNNFTHGFMRNVARDSFDSVAGRYGMDQIMGDNNAFLTEVRKRLQDEVATVGVVIDQFGLVGAPRPPQPVREAINAKAKATQDAIRVENELRMATAEAQKRVAQAEGESRANVQRAEGEAKANALLASSLTPTIIEWQRLQIQQHQTARWNGVLPTVTGTQPMMLLNQPK